MEIMIGVTISNDLKSSAVERCKELLVHGLVADNAFVNSAVIMRSTVPSHPLGWQRFVPDENTRQER